MSWLPQETAYSRVTGITWNFILDRVEVEPNGLKTYLAYCCLDPATLRGTDWPHNPAFLYSQFVDSAVLYYQYSGDQRVIRFAQSLLDYDLAHGLTPPDWEWGAVPYASSDPGSVEYRGADDTRFRPGVGDGPWVIEPDKIAELGYACLRLYEQSGEKRFLGVASSWAATLAQHVRAGDEGHSPWPFRVRVETGIVIEEYSANTIAAIRLFDELLRLNVGDRTLFTAARDLAWRWVLTFPMQNNRWMGVFEDVAIESGIENINQYSALETARYLLQNPEIDPDWRGLAGALLTWVEQNFLVDVPDEPAVQWGAGTVSEQAVYMRKMGSHTARYASVLALWHEKTGDRAAREKAFRSFNWATYMCRRSGIVTVGPVDQSVWFSDGYGDYIRHFLRGMASAPAWAPPGETHLLGSSTVVQSVSRLRDGFSYRTFDPDSTEILRLNFRPVRVTADGRRLPRRQRLSTEGWSFDESTGVAQIRHAGAHAIRIFGAPPVARGDCSRADCGRR